MKKARGEIPLDIQRTVIALLTADTADLRALALIAGRDPSTFYRGANLRRCDLSKADLEGIDLAGADKSHAKMPKSFGRRPSNGLVDETSGEFHRLQNLSNQLTAVLLRVANLNERGLHDEAGDTLDVAIKFGNFREAEIETLQDAALHQDRLRNRPAAAAARMLESLKVSGPPGGVFSATRNLIHEALKLGETKGDPYDLALAVELSTVNLSRARGRMVSVALNDLGISHLALGGHMPDGGHFAKARDAFLNALRLTSRSPSRPNWAAFQDNLGLALSRLGEREAAVPFLQQAINAHEKALAVYTQNSAPLNWARSQNNLGVALFLLSERQPSFDGLQRAIDAHRAALTIHTPETAPLEWAKAQGNLGNALQALGNRLSDPSHLKLAIDAHRAALSIRTREMMPGEWAKTQNNLGLSLHGLGILEGNANHFAAARDILETCLTVHTRGTAPFPWANIKWNLADLALAWHTLDPQPERLDTAQHHLDAARSVFAEAGNTHQIAECDRLQRLIDEARAAGGAAPPSGNR